MTAPDSAPFRAATRAIADPEGAGAAAAARFGAPVASWARGDDVLTGYGTALRLPATGPGRIASASAAWRAAVAGVEVDDTVRVGGTGPLAFGSFAFADASTAPGGLVVPRVVVGRRGGVAFRTEVAGGPEEALFRAAPLAEGTAFSPTAYAAAVTRAVAAIRAGRLEKVVLARDLVVPAPGVDPAALVGALRTRYRDSWVFAVDGLVGASPETLVTVAGGRVASRVLAGTAARGRDDAEDAAARAALLVSPKNRFEHALAVDSLLLTLGPLVDDLDIARPHALRLPNVWHLATDATARARPGTGALDLVAALHPTAAVAGAPREEALALIAELEPFDRGRYAGPVGWIDAAGDGEWAIALRCAEVQHDAVRAYAGAGVVAASDAASELAETGWKLQPVLEALGALVPR